MKKLLLVCSMFSFSLVSFSQDSQNNGTIYIKHPYISVIENLQKLYLKNDAASAANAYADTARYWASGMTKRVPIKDALNAWANDYKFYDSITLKVVGYPDYLEYTKDNARVVQSWWLWSGVSKKTGKKLNIRFAEFDDFSADGKIVMEQMYGDFSKLETE